MNSSKQHLKIIIRDSSEMIINGTHAHHGIEPRVLTSLVASSACMKMLNVYPLLPQKLRGKSYGLMLVYISHLSKHLQLLNYQFVGKMLVCQSDTLKKFQYLEYKSYKLCQFRQKLCPWMIKSKQLGTIAKKWIVGDKINTDHK